MRQRPSTVEQLIKKIDDEYGKLHEFHSHIETLPTIFIKQLLQYVITGSQLKETELLPQICWSNWLFYRALVQDIGSGRADCASGASNPGQRGLPHRVLTGRDRTLNPRDRNLLPAILRLSERWSGRVVPTLLRYV